jgi:hypothetical protein
VILRNVKRVMLQSGHQFRRYEQGVAKCRRCDRLFSDVELLYAIALSPCSRRPIHTQGTG